MTQELNNIRHNSFDSIQDHQEYERQILALDAMTKLSRQFSVKQDIYALIDSIILTLAGQFVVTNAVVRLLQPASPTTNRLFFGTGQFKTDKLLESFEIQDIHCNYLMNLTGPQFIDRLDLPGTASNFSFILAECGVRVIIPLVHNNHVIGIFGLGEKVNKKPYIDTDLKLLDTFVQTITPLIVNSFLFTEISSVGNWYLKILNNVKQAVFVFDTSNRLIKINDTGFAIQKMIRPTLINPASLNQIPIDLVFPDQTFPGWLKKLCQPRQRQTDVVIEKLKMLHLQNTRLFNVSVSAIHRDNTDDTDLIVTLDDVTEIEENERRMFDLEKFAEKGMMASSISHELNNFLGLIMGGVELTQMALAENDTDKASGTLEKLKPNILKMERFTAGLMDYARLDTSKKVDSLNDIVADVIQFVSVQGRYDAITIKTEYDDNLPLFELDTDQMAQLLINLLNNAADAINESSQSSGEISVQTRFTDSRANLVITDNGIGMADDVREKLFKSHLTTKPKGHGYGLVTCSKIIENHQGRVEILSEKGKGTTFILTFPVA